MAAQAMSSYGVKNCLIYAFNALRSMDRFVEDSLQSPYELFHENLAKSLSRGKKIEYSISNSEVEGFYLKRSSEIDFIADVQSKILSKVSLQGPGGGGGTCPLSGGSSTFASVLHVYGPLFAHVWDLVSENNTDICSKLPSISGKQLWEIFLKLDTESELKVHVDDIVEIVLKIFKANGHYESESKIKEWFRGNTSITFREFLGPLVEKFVGLLQAHIITEVNRELVSEFFKEGRLEKKGHVVHNWKMRWFVLTGNSLTYYETPEKAVVKGSLAINSNAVVQNMPEYRARPHRFRVICGESRTVTEISANDASTMQEWIYTIRMAIKIHQTSGRNFIHKWKQVMGNKSSRKGVPHSTSVDKILAPPNHPPPKHRGLSATQSVPDTRKSPDGDIEVAVRGATPTSPTSSEDGTCSPKGLSHSASYTDAPPLPPQRFGSPEVKDLSSPQVLDKAALAEKRMKGQGAAGSQRLGSLEPQDIEHIMVEGEDYAIVKRSPKIKKKLPADLSAIINPPAGKSDTGSATEKKKMPVKQRSVDSTLHEDAKVKKSADNIQLPRSPKPARRSKDAMTPTGSPRRMPEKTNRDDVTCSSISHITDNGLDYAIVDTTVKKKKSSNSSLPSPMSSEQHQLDAADKEVGGKNESLERRRIVIQPDDEKVGDKRKIEYSTVVFGNSVPTPEPGEQKKVEVKDFDRTKFDYSTVVFQNINLSEDDKKAIIKPSKAHEGHAKGKVKKSIYDSDDDEHDVNNESPYMNVRRDGRPITSNVPPAVPPRRGAAAIIDDTDST